MNTEYTCIEFVEEKSYSFDPNSWCISLQNVSIY